MIERDLRILPNLDQVAVWIAHVATPFPAVVIERLSEKDRTFFTPLFVTGPDVRDPQIEEAIHCVEISGRFEKNLRLVGRWTATGIENDPRVGELDVAGILRL